MLGPITWAFGQRAAPTLYYIGYLSCSSLAHLEASGPLRKAKGCSSRRSSSRSSSYSPSYSSSYSSSRPIGRRSDRAGAWGRLSIWLWLRSLAHWTRKFALSSARLLATGRSLGLARLARFWRLARQAQAAKIELKGSRSGAEEQARVQMQDATS